MKKVVFAGLLGGLVMAASLVVVDGLLGVRQRFDMNALGNERVVYGFLAEHVTEPGRYVLNPQVVPGQGFPGDEPIFAVHYTGLGHADAGREMLTGLLLMLLACGTGAWLVAHASTGIRARYASRLGYFGLIGLVTAMMGTGVRFGLAAYALEPALALAAHDLVIWVLAGLVVAAVRPENPSRRRVVGEGNS